MFVCGSVLLFLCLQIVIIKMTSHRIISFIIIYILAVRFRLVNGNPVSIKVAYPGTTNILTINFNNNTFKQLYNCMINTSTFSCTFTTLGDQKTNYSDLLVQGDVTVDNTSSNHELFSCKYKPSTNKIVFQKDQDGPCVGTLCQSFRLFNSPYQSKCVSIRWLLDREQLNYTTETDNIVACNSPCNTCTTNIIHTSVEVTPSDSPSSDKVPIIVGTICGVLVIVIAVIVVILLWRRRQLGKNNGKGQNRIITSASTDGPVRDKPHPTRSAQATSNYANVHDDQTTTTNTKGGVKQDENSNDGYYTHDYDFTESKYQNLSGQSHKQINDQTRNNEQMTQDTDIDTDDGYSCILETSRVNVNDGNLTDVESSNDVYSFAKNVNNEEEKGITPEPKNIYSRLGDKVKLLTNPYNGCFGSSDAPECGNPISDYSTAKLSPEQEDCEFDDISSEYPYPLFPGSSVYSEGKEPPSASKSLTSSVADLPDYAVALKANQ